MGGAYAQPNQSQSTSLNQILISTQNTIIHNALRHKHIG